ncbi:MAG: M14 family metallopeptidase, partial [Candidatus Aminicenantes bacterium]|nr:M14 family metallopeptidase [Candidatus Aminicenantes bacterium]
IRVETMCRTVEGRDVPLLILGRPLPDRPKDDGRLVVYIQANIHAGEVEGKEACLMLARDMLLAPRPLYLDKLVVLIAPIFNADGNERISPDNRREQVGPANGVGIRYNAQNLDLNRDATKLESPEMRGLVAGVLNRWDPALVVDCHTTNGSYHQEPVTYSWPLNPNGDPAILRYQRDTMLPAIQKAMAETYGTLAIPFGDPVDWRDMEKGWGTYGHHPRYVTNYVGLRNRLSILDENYSYADFKTRVLGCYSLLRAILDYCAANADEIRGLVRAADERTIRTGTAPSTEDGFALEVEAKALPEKITVRGYEMEIIPREGTWPQIKKTDKERTYVLPYFADYVPKKTIRRPFAYLVEPADPDVVAVLRRHGLIVERLAAPAQLEVEAFKIASLKPAARLNQGHWTTEIKGDYAAETRAFSAGAVVIRTGQPLGSLACYLLEPASDDGLFFWNAFDRYLIPQWGRGFGPCPVYRLLAPAALKTEPLD